VAQCQHDLVGAQASSWPVALVEDREGRECVCCWERPRSTSVTLLEADLTPPSAMICSRRFSTTLASRGANVDALQTKNIGGRRQR
jgi:hypothetical protein